MTASLIGFAALLALVFLRVPIAFAMAAVGTVGFAMLRSWPAAWAMVGNAAFETGLSYSLSVVPLFILMGNLLTISGVSHGLYAAANALFGRVRGGLAMASVVACGGFSAVCGSSLATAATMSQVAMPSMRRYGYADRLAAGSIAAGGTLGILIPPSVILIVYGLLTETDIGRLFIAGVVPGAVGVVFYVLAVAVVVRLDPAAAPRAAQPEPGRPAEQPRERLDPAAAPRAAQPEPFSNRERFGVAAVAGLFVLILGGIYGGLFTPTEAAGVGAGAALCITAAAGGVTAARLFDACVQTARTTAMIFAILIGAEIFSHFINFAGLPEALAAWTASLGLNAWVVMAGIVLIYLALGCVLESLSMILLTVPVFAPLMYELDFASTALATPDAALIWFGIVVVVATEISLITPPVGLNVFVLRNVLPDVPLNTIFRGVAPFWIADILRLLLLIAVPSLSLWLVGLM